MTYRLYLQGPRSFLTYFSRFEPVCGRYKVESINNNEVFKLLVRPTDSVPGWSLTEIGQLETEMKNVGGVFSTNWAWVQFSGWDTSMGVREDNLSVVLLLEALNAYVSAGPDMFPSVRWKPFNIVSVDTKCYVLFLHHSVFWASVFLYLLQTETPLRLENKNI